MCETIDKRSAAGEDLEMKAYIDRRRYYTLRAFVQSLRRLHNGRCRRKSVRHHSGARSTKRRILAAREGSVRRRFSSKSYFRDDIVQWVI